MLDDKQIEALNITFKDFDNSTMVIMTECADKEFDFEYKIIVFDVEVYGTNANNGELVMLHAVYLENGEEKDRFKRYIKPSRKIKNDFEQITGIQPDLVAGGDELSVAIKDFNEWHKEALWCDGLVEYVYPILERAFWMSDIKLERDGFELLGLLANKMPNTLKPQLWSELAKRFNWTEDQEDVELSVTAFKKIYGEYCE